MLSLILRTWLIMGLIAPVTVAGSSMAPTMQGAHVTVSCPRCEETLDVDVEFAFGGDKCLCPHCGEAELSLANQPIKLGDRLWIDRTAWQCRRPQRWEVVVAQHPEDGTQLCVKRVVGLPGELVSLHDGDVLINGSIVTKDVDSIRALRHLVHREDHTRFLRWQSSPAAAWQMADNSWLHSEPSEAKTHWLTYQHPEHRPLTDDVLHNVGLTRQLNFVDEFQIAATVCTKGNGTLSLLINDGTTTAQVDMKLPSGSLTLVVDGQACATAQLSQSVIGALIGAGTKLEFANIDGQLSLRINDDEVLSYPWPANNAVGIYSPVAIGAQGLEVSVSDLALYRDVCYTPQAAGSRPSLTAAWQLGPDEYFLLGDNPPVSVDSRTWGPVPARLLIGKPLGVR